MIDKMLNNKSLFHAIIENSDGSNWYSNGIGGFYNENGRTITPHLNGYRDNRGSIYTPWGSGSISVGKPIFSSLNSSSFLYRNGLVSKIGNSLLSPSGGALFGSGNGGSWGNGRGFF